MLTMADQQKVVYDLSNGAIFNYLKRPLPRFLGHAILWRYISETVCATFAWVLLTCLVTKLCNID